MKIRPFVAVGLLVFAAPLSAQNFSGLPEPISPDRPDFTEGAGLMAPGHLQIEGGYTYARTGSAKGSALGELLVRYGVDDRWEARFGLGSYDWIDTGVPGEKRISGYEDPFLEVKIRLNEADSNLRAPSVPAMALLLQTTIPVGSRDLTSDEWQPAAILAADWDFTDRFSLGGNVGVAYAADGDERFDQLFLSLSAAFSINDRLSAFLEGYGFNKESVDGSSTQYVDTGLSWLVSNDLALDVRVGAGLDDPHPNWYAGLGASIRF